MQQNICLTVDYLLPRQQENLVDNQKFQAGFRPLCNKILLPCPYLRTIHMIVLHKLA